MVPIFFTHFFKKNSFRNVRKASLYGENVESSRLVIILILLNEVLLWSIWNQSHSLHFKPIPNFSITRNKRFERKYTTWMRSTYTLLWHMQETYFYTLRATCCVSNFTCKARWYSNNWFVFNSRKFCLKNKSVLFIIVRSDIFLLSYGFQTHKRIPTLRELRELRESHNTFRFKLGTRHYSLVRSFLCLYFQCQRRFAHHITVLAWKTTPNIILYKWRKLEEM